MYKTTDKIGQLKMGISTKIIPNLPEIPGNNYRLIVVDPPWAYTLREKDPSHRGRCPYPSMEPTEIKKMPVGKIAETDAYLLLWTTNNHLPLAFECLEKWGFSYKAVFTWVKICKDSDKPKIGIGHYGRNCTEHFLVGRKGSPPSFTSLGLTNIPNVILESPTSHSSKPQKFWEIANRLAEALGGNRIELFARTKREGWESWGTLENEMDI